MSNGTFKTKLPLSAKLGELKTFLQALRCGISREVDSKIIQSIDNLVRELEIKQSKSQNGVKPKSAVFNYGDKPKELATKEFIIRNSTLTNLWEVTHLRSVGNICVAFFFLVYLNVFIFYSLDSKKLAKDISVVIWTFSKFHIATAIWFAMNLSIVFLLYPAFRIWATARLEIKKNRLHDVLFCTLFVVYQLALLVIPAELILVYNLPPVTSFIVLAEQARLIMKTHAFVRENAARALRYKPHQDGDKDDSKPYPEVGKLIYFLFVPTLVYRESYPRTPSIRWSYVAWYFMQVISCILGAYIPCTYFIVDVFNKIGIEPIPLVNFIGILAMSLFAGGLLMFLAFYGIFHCWMNAFAEMLQFGDRLFYDDWWNCTSFAKYYRTWNMVVSDWLHAYIYRDMHSFLGLSRAGAMSVVLIISGVMHEYTLAVTFKLFLPLLLFMYSFLGMILAFITRRQTSNIWNVLLLVCLFQGWGLIAVFYSVEWYARINCPRALDSWLDYFVPRLFTCDIISVP